MKKRMALTMGIGCLLTCSIFVGNAYGAELNETKYIAKTAHIVNVDKYGAKLADDEYDQNRYTCDDTAVTVRNNENALTVSMVFDDAEITLTGYPQAASENGNVIYYKAESSSSNYEVVNFTYEREIDKSSYYFKEYHKQHPTEDTILKLYLKPNNKSNDYILMEIFGYNLLNYDSVLEDVSDEDCPPSWIITEFEPRENQAVKEANSPKTNSLTQTFRQTYTFRGWEETHTITYELYNNAPANISKGQQGEVQYRIKVTGKTVSAPSAPNYNSSDSSYLSIVEAKLTQVTFPYAGFTRTVVSGTFHKATGAVVTGSPSLDLAIGKGPVSVGLSIPISFDKNTTVKLNSEYTLYENTSSQLTRSIATTSPKNAYLMKIGDNFIVESQIQDYGNKALSRQNYQGRWNIVIQRMDTSMKYNRQHTHNLTISVV